MDARVLAWGRRVKAAHWPAGRTAPLWLFTDANRLCDPLPSIRRLPRGLAGVVLRHGEPHDGAVARLCRARGLALSVAGDWRLALRLRAGAHLRGGRVAPGAPPWLRRLTGSAHTVREIGRCRRAGVEVIFISPVFATASHPGGRTLGALRWAAWARLAGSGAAALGGIDGRTIRSLPPCCRAVGAIGALRA